MPRPSSRRALGVWMNGERVGTWTTRAGASDEFVYVPDWLQSSAARPISLSMPLAPTPYNGDRVTSFFDNLLPDARPIRERVQRRFRTRTTGAFDLLAEIGRDCVGALQLLPEGDAPADVRSINGERLTRRGVEKHLEQLLTVPAGPGSLDDFRISLAGAQEKTALLRAEKQWMRPLGATPSTHILKLPIGITPGGIDLGRSIENEWLCARILRELDVAVAHGEMARFGEQHVLVVERFDRRMAPDGSWIMRLPQEDLCQATGTPPGRKYEAEGGPGIRRIMELLLGSSRAAEDRRDFFRTQMLFWMLCAIDGHAKNFSVFLEAGGGYRLTPRYDVMSAHPVLGTRARMLSPKKVKMAMAVEGANRHYTWSSILPRHWEETARQCGLAAEYPRLREELLTHAPHALEAVQSGLPSGFPEDVSRPILAGLKRARDVLAKG